MPLSLPLGLPAVRVTIGDIVVAGVTATQVSTVAGFRAGHFSVNFALGGGPLSDIGYFSGLGMETITIEAGVAAGGFTPLFVGQIDNVRIDFARQMAVLSGRDLTARLIDRQVAQTFANQTASQIAGAVAVANGLTAEVTATSDVVGQYYELDHARNTLVVNSRAANQWDLLVRLAVEQDFIVAVNGFNLYFGPPPVLPTVAINVKDCISVEIDQALTIPAAATVKSWSVRNKQAITQSTAAAETATVLVRPNLSSSQAAQLAAAHLAALVPHKVRLRLSMPGELALTPGVPVALQGTQSALDQLYLIDAIEREIDGLQGFTETIRAHAVVA